MDPRDNTALAHALIGCGRVAPNHVDGVRQLGCAWSVAAVSDPAPGVAAQFAAEHGVSRHELDTARILDDPAITSVSIITDHAGHAELVDRALDAGKHVLVEKPLAMDVVRAQALAAKAATSGLVLMVVSQHLYDPIVVAVRDWLSRGLLGDLVYARGELEGWREPSYYADSYWHGTWHGEGGSALVNQGYHSLDVLRALCGGLEATAAIAVLGAPGAPMETEHTLSALLRAGAVPVSFTVTVASSITWRTRIVVVGTRGTVEFDIDHPAQLHRADGDGALAAAAAQLSRAHSEVLQAAPGIDYYGISHRAQIADFAAAVTTGAVPATTPADGVAMVRLLDAVYRATGAPARGGLAA